MRPLPFILPLLILLLHPLPQTHARTTRHPKGINCLGSLECYRLDDWWTPIPIFLSAALEAVEPSGPLRYGNATTYRAGEHILCKGNALTFGTACVFLEGDHVPPQGVPMWIVIERLGMLNRHGCRICGSVPLSLDNNPRKYGWLVSNYVENAWCGDDRFCLAVGKEGVLTGGVEWPWYRPVKWDPERAREMGL